MARITLAQTAFIAGELSPRVLGRTDMDRYAFGLKKCRNAHPVIHGGFKRRGGTLYAATAATSTASASILVPFVQGRALSWMIEFSNLSAKIYNADGGYSGITLVTPYTTAMLATLDWAQSDSTLWLFNPLVTPQRLQRLGSGTWVISPAPFSQVPFYEVGFVAAGTGTLSASTVGAGRTLTDSTAEFLASDVGRAVTFDAGIAVITGYTSTTVVTVEITRAFPSVTLTAGQWTVDSSPQTTCTPSAKDPEGAAITLTLGAAGWRAANVGAIVKINGGVVKITGYTSPTVVDAVIIKELSAIVAAPALSWTLEPPIWSAAYGYPRTGTIHQQRLICAGNAKFPRTVWGSVLGEQLNFQMGTLDSDACAFTIDGDDATPITYVTSGQDLVVLTESSEYSLRSGVEKPITPTNVRIKPESGHGTAQVRPAQLNRETLFVQRAGRKVRAFGYRYDYDAYNSPDIVALAEHITKSGITSMAYAQEPEQILWAVRADGQFISCTIDRDQQPSVIAWALHDTVGMVDSLAVIPNGDREQVWLIVRRLVNGAYQRFIERMDDTFTPHLTDDSIIYGTTVDSGMVFDNPAGATSFSVPHLAGQVVDIVADGSKMPRVTVAADGAVTIPRSGKRVLIGLPFPSYGTLLTPEVQTGFGSAQGQPARTGKTKMRFLDTIGAVIQNNQGNKQVVPFRQFGPGILDQAPMPFSGLVDISLLGWETGDSEVTVYQEDPLPMHVLSVVRQHTING
ncbi:hypothetical protein [Roseateles sp. PN1]|uniref:hypothetical protein n=1 Tax=Roseateles sp. PN1 TaxID=3137372 RepID=UPI003139BC9B